MFEVIRHVHNQEKHELGILKAKHCHPSEPTKLINNYLGNLSIETTAKATEIIKPVQVQTPRRSVNMVKITPSLELKDTDSHEIVNNWKGKMFNTL